MSVKGSTFANDLLKLIFNGTPISILADNAASAPLGDLYVALHAADPGDSGDQTTNEIAYTGYARATVVRTSSGWVVTGNSVSPGADIVFGSCTGGSGTATFASIGTSLTGAGKMLYRGALGASISISTGVTPTIDKATTFITEA